MDFSKTNQEQKAGANSSQYQQIGDNSNQTIIENQTNNVTITGLGLPDVVTLTTTVFTQVSAQALNLCTQVSENVCKQKIDKFGSIWIPRLTRIENIVNNLIDPKFQFMIRDANISAAKSSRQEDLEMLTQLLVCHIEKGKDMKVDAGINKAIQIVDQVDYVSLCALTCMAAIFGVCSGTGNIKEGLQFMDDLFSKLLYTELPAGDDWIDHLGVLGAVVIQTGHFMKFEETYSSLIDGYVCVGVKKDSEEHKKVIEILKSNDIDIDELVENELLPGYLRLSVVQKASLNKELQSIFDLYSKDKELMNLSKSKFFEMWNSFPNLKTIKEWYDNFPFYFRITSVGYALAQTNAKRCFPDFPDII
jgi:hypothetical protein